MVFSSLAASCCCCAENPLIPPAQISRTSSVYATGSKVAPAKPDDWSPTREVELNPVLSSLIPPPSEEELEKQKLENWVAKKIQT